MDRKLLMVWKLFWAIKTRSFHLLLSESLNKPPLLVRTTKVNTGLPQNSLSFCWILLGTESKKGSSPGGWPTSSNVLTHKISWGAFHRMLLKALNQQHSQLLGLLCRMPYSLQIISIYRISSNPNKNSMKWILLFYVCRGENRPKSFTQIIQNLRATAYQWRGFRLVLRGLNPSLDWRKICFWTLEQRPKMRGKVGKCGEVKAEDTGLTSDHPGICHPQAGTASHKPSLCLEEGNWWQKLPRSLP